MTAGFLLALLVFIHTEKAVHHHESIIAKTQQEGISSSSKAFVCSICDYVFAKDAGLLYLPAVKIPVTYFEEEFKELQSLYHTSVTFSCIGRGPPVC